jgi:zinc transport system substrate-binding protein
MTVMNASRRLIRTAATAAVLGLGTTGLTACSNDGGGPGENEKTKVVAAFYPLQFLAKEIGGGHVDVETLTKPGGEPHDLELSPQQTGRLTEADLVVYLKGLQPAVDEGVQQAEPKHVAEASSYTSLEKTGAEGTGEDSGEDGGHKPGHDHDHASAGEGNDPHLWLDPVRYAQVAEGVGKQLAVADPAHKKTYAKNTRALTGRLRALDKDFKDGLEGRRTDTFITTHAAFGYLADRYGLHQAAVSGVDPESEPSGARMKELHDIAEEDEVDTVFFESSASDRTAKTLAADLRLKTAVLSPLESVRKGEDYFSVMQRNLSALKSALGAHG